jgi:hypothetical protein
MTYDFNLFRPSAGLSLEEAAEKWLEEEEEAVLRGQTSPVDPAKEELKKNLSNELRKKNPALSSFEQPEFRAIELMGPANGNGIQISIFEDSAAIAFPYWHKGNGAEGVMREVWGYLEILERVGNFRTFDPQLGRVLDLRKEDDFQQALSIYKRTIEAVGANLDTRGAAAKPWWKFW